MTIVLAGGSGFIGTQLAKALIKRGHTVIVIDMRAPSFTNKELFFIQCDLSHQPLPYNVLEHTDAVINLIGAPISNKWTTAYKELIRMSRIQSTKTIVEAITGAQSRPSVFINASATGYYGDTGEGVVDEQGVKGSGFLSDVVSEWEQMALEAESAGVRVVLIRTAPVLGNGGMLSTLLQTARFGFLLKLSQKDFWMSWIHQDDLVAIYLFALETTTLQGVVNASAIEHVRHHDFMQLLSNKTHKRLLGTIPRFITRRVFGELYEEMTTDQQVDPRRLADKGFSFTYPTLSEALSSLFLNNTATKK